MYLVTLTSAEEAKQQFYKVTSLQGVCRDDRKFSALSAKATKFHIVYKHMGFLFRN